MPRLYLPRLRTLRFVLVPALALIALTVSHAFTASVSVPASYAGIVTMDVPEWLRAQAACEVAGDIWVGGETVADDSCQRSPKNACADQHGEWLYDAVAGEYRCTLPQPQDALQAPPPVVTPPPADPTPTESPTTTEGTGSGDQGAADPAQDETSNSGGDTTGEHAADITSDAVD